MDLQQIALRVAQRIKAIAVKETTPVRTGELRRSITVQSYGSGAVVGTNKVYARAVHEGRRALIIRPKNKKALFWRGAAHPIKQVFQPARKGKPFLRQAADSFGSNIEDEARSLGIDDQFADVLKSALENKGLDVKNS